MKNLLKKLLSLSLIVTCVLGLSQTAFAETTMPASDLDSLLESRGYPKIVLESMDNDLKEIIYNENNEFSGATVSYYDDTSNTFTDISIDENGDYILPRGQISTSSLSMALIYTKNKASNGNLNSIRIYYNYKWLKLPVFRWQDPIAVSWDNTKFQMSDNSFKKVDKYDGYIVDSNGTMHTYTNQIHSSENGYANASNAGVSWYADLKGYTGIIPTNLYGYAIFDLVPTHSTSSGSTTLYAHYVHPTAAINIGINIASYGNFSISGGGDYDERGNQHTISW